MNEIIHNLNQIDDELYNYLNYAGLKIEKFHRNLCEQTDIQTNP